MFYINIKLKYSFVSRLFILFRGVLDWWIHLFLCKSTLSLFRSVVPYTHSWAATVYISSMCSFQSRINTVVSGLFTFLLAGSVWIPAPCHCKLCRPASPYWRSSLGCDKYQVAFHQDESNHALNLSSSLLSHVVELRLVNLLTSTYQLFEYWSVSWVPVYVCLTHICT
jgi:hypothetical protein